MKNTKSQKLRLGLFVIIGTLLFIAAVYLIGQRQNMFKKTFTISAYFQNVNCEIVLDKKDPLVDSLSKSGLPFATLTIIDRNNGSNICEFFHKHAIAEKNCRITQTSQAESQAGRRGRRAFESASTGQQVVAQPQDDGVAPRGTLRGECLRDPASDGCGRPSRRAGIPEDHQT